MKNKSYLTLKYRLKLAEATNLQLRKKLQRIKDVVSNMNWSNANSALCGVKGI